MPPCIFAIIVLISRSLQLMAGEIYKDPKKDFEALKYKVFSGNNLINQKEFSSFKEELEGVEVGEDTLLDRKDLDKVIRYAMIMFDKKSPLIRHSTNLQVRKDEAALVAGYDRTKDQDALKKIFDFSDLALQIITIKFLKEQQDTYWSMIISSEQTFYEYQQALLEPVTSFKDDKDKLAATQLKSKLMDDSDRIAERIETYYAKVFGDADTQKTAKKLKGLSPEAQANR